MCVGVSGRLRTFCFGDGFFYYLKWGGERRKGVKEGGGGEGERVGLKSWKRRGRTGELET